MAEIKGIGEHGNARHSIKNAEKVEATAPRTHSQKQQVVDKPVIPTFEISLKHFGILGIIGEGAFGKVKKIERRKGPKGVYALKYIDKTKCIEKRATYNMFRERIVLQKLSSPFVVRLRYAFQDDENLFMVLDLAEGGDLRCHLERLEGVTDDNLMIYAAEISCALNYLHHNNIVHRDLKPENLLMNKEGHLVLTDFNVCANLEESIPTSASGTRPYMAPEMLIKQPYTYSADWWATGIILYECKYGKRPYKVDKNWTRENFENPPLAFLTKFYKTEISIPSDSKRESFIKGLLEINVSNRLGCSNNGLGFETDIKTHPYLESINWVLAEQMKLEPSYKPNLKAINMDAALLIDEIVAGGDGLAYRPRKGSKHRSFSQKVTSGIKKILGIKSKTKDGTIKVLTREQREMELMDTCFTTYNWELPDQQPMIMPQRHAHDDAASATESHDRDDHKSEKEHSSVHEKVKHGSVPILNSKLNQEIKPLDEDNNPSKGTLPQNLSQAKSKSSLNNQNVM